MAANVFQAFYETESLGGVRAGPTTDFPGGTGLEWGEQKNEDPYNDPQIDPNNTTARVEIINTQSPPQGSQCMQMYIKTDDVGERRCQVAEYNNSGLSALTTVWVRFKMKIAATITSHIFTVPEPWHGYIRIFEYLPYISVSPFTVFHTCPALMFQRFSGANQSNRLWIVFNTGDDTGTNEQFPDSVPVGQWVTILIKNVVHHTAGVIQVWMDGVEQLNLTGLDTYPTGSDSMQVTQECSGMAMDSVSPTIIYYDDYQVNADNVWSTTSAVGINRGCASMFPRFR